MTVNTIPEYGEPDPGAEPAVRPSADTEQQAHAGPPLADAAPSADSAVQAYAAATITGLLAEQPAVGKEIKNALRTNVHVHEMARHADAAEAEAADAEQRESNLAVKLDPGERRTLPFGLGAAIILALVVLDMFPLNWAAQAFDLDSAGTWLVTFILLIASIGAMLAFEITRGHVRRRAVLIAVVTAGYLALLGLRAEYLVTVTGDSFLVAVFQSALLTAISAGLVLCGSALLARTRSLRHSRARATYRHAVRAAADARQAHGEAHDKLQRHLDALHHMLLTWALLHAPAPAGVDHAKWAAALKQAIRALM
jgi:hypothetical protein